MSIFDTILQKLGINKPAAAPSTGIKPPQESPSFSSKPGMSTVTPGSMAPTGMPNMMPMVDVMSKLDGMARANPEHLDWKVSIVDLLKLLGLPATSNDLKALATELGCPANLMADSAAMNTWLHKTVLQKLAANGGNIPPELYKH